MRLSEYSFDNHRVHKICNQTLSTFFDSLEKIAGNDQLRYFINQVGIIQGYLTHPPDQSCNPNFMRAEKLIALRGVSKLFKEMKCCFFNANTSKLVDCGSVSASIQPIKILILQIQYPDE